jgi:ribosomal protein S27AE
MPGKQKINREKVEAALNTLCPKCGYSITPAEIRRIDFDKMQCPKCGERFAATKSDLS